MAQRRYFDPQTGELVEAGVADMTTDPLTGEALDPVEEEVGPTEAQPFRFTQQAISGQATGAAGGINRRVALARSPALRGAPIGQNAPVDPWEGIQGAARYQMLGVTPEMGHLANQMGLNPKQVGRGQLTGPGEMPQDLMQEMRNRGYKMLGLGGSAGNKQMEKNLGKLARSNSPLAAKAQFYDEIFQPGEFHRERGMFNSGGSSQQARRDAFRTFTRINELDPTAVSRLMQDDEFRDPRVQGGIGKIGMRLAYGQDGLSKYMEETGKLDEEGNPVMRFDTSGFRQSAKDIGRPSDLFGSPGLKQGVVTGIKMAPSVLMTAATLGAATPLTMAQLAMVAAATGAQQGFATGMESGSLKAGLMAGGTSAASIFGGGAMRALTAPKMLAGPFGAIGRAGASGMGISAGMGAAAGGQAAATGGGTAANTGVSGAGGVGAEGTKSAGLFSKIGSLAQTPAGQTIKIGGKLGQAGYSAAQGSREAMHSAIREGMSQPMADPIGDLLTVREMQGAQSQAAGVQRQQQLRSIFQDNPFYDPVEDFATGQSGVV